MSEDNLYYLKFLKIQEELEKEDIFKTSEYIKYPVIGKIRLKKDSSSVFRSKKDDEYEIGKIVDAGKKTYFITNDKREYHVGNKTGVMNVKIPFESVEEIIVDWDKVK